MNDESLPAATELGVGFVSYSPLGRGFLTAVAEVVGAVAEQQGATPAHVALAWLRYRSEAMGVAAVPIPGTRCRATGSRI